MASSPFLYPIRVYHVRPYYPDTGCHLLEMYTLEVSNSGILWWIFHHAQSVSTYKKLLQRRMYRLNRREGVPTLQGIRHGYRLTKRQFDKLCGHLLIASTKITRKENYYVVS